MEMSRWVGGVSWRQSDQDLLTGGTPSNPTDSETRAPMRDEQFCISVAWELGALRGILVAAGASLLGPFQIHPQDGTMISREAKLLSAFPGPSPRASEVVRPYTHLHRTSLFLPSPVPNFPFSRFKQQIFTRSLLYVTLT